MPYLPLLQSCSLGHFEYTASNQSPNTRGEVVAYIDYGHSHSHFPPRVERSQNGETRRQVPCFPHAEKESGYVETSQVVDSHLRRGYRTPREDLDSQPQRRPDTRKHHIEWNLECDERRQHELVAIVDIIGRDANVLGESGGDDVADVALVQL